MALHLVMLGPPGAGKGTQAERLAREFGIPRISTGDILREAIQSGSDLGRAVQAVMARGELVGDDLIVGIVRERLSRPGAAGGFVLDGFPRTVPQAEALDALMAGRPDPVVVVDLAVPDEELVRRVRARRVCADCGANADAFGDGASRVPPACRAPERCGAEGPRWVARADDAEAVVRERLAVYRRESRPLIDFYRGRPAFRAVDGRHAPEQVREAIVAAVAAAGVRPGQGRTPGGEEATA